VGDPTSQYGRAVPVGSWHPLVSGREDETCHGVELARPWTYDTAWQAVADRGSRKGHCNPLG
jgi:hypothetical protein